MCISEGTREEELGGDPELPVVSSDWIDRLIFLGTGTSGQVPAIGCLLRTASEATGRCAACFDAIKPGSKNRRGCTSVAIVGRPPSPEQEEGLIVIDCGPTFYTSALTHFAAQKLRKIDAVLLTHGHADAILGLDTLRSWTMGGVIQNHVDVYCSRQCFDTVAAMFPYLVDTSRSTGGGGVGDVKFHIIDPQQPFTLRLLNGDQVTVTPLPAHHGRVGGDPFECLGFRIDSFSYLSDCHYIPPSTTQLIARSQVVALDALNPYRHASHFSLSQALSYTLSMPTPLPRLSLLTDLTHNLEHHSTERSIQQWKAGLQGWRDEMERNGNLSLSIDQVGRGEAGGPRWWDGKWDERKSEQTRNLSVSSRLFPTGASKAETDCHARLAATLPQIHVTWDGMVVRFDRRDR